MQNSKVSSKPRHLVICTDGTWNTPGRMDRDRMVASNVVEMARAIAGESLIQSQGSQFEQLVYYDTGIGTDGSWFNRSVEGAFGIGLQDQIKCAYEAIANVFVPSDKLFLFGFSRGAYTARSLAGLIGLCGIPNRENCNIKISVEQALKIYRTTKRIKRLEDAKNFIAEKSYTVNDQPIKKVHFIGVWDTVGALGVPCWPFRWFGRKRYAFHDVSLGTHVKHAYHAVAIDERRYFFKPTFWLDVTPNQNVEQVWFAGVHSNVGGGYVDSGLSDRAFLWMCLKAVNAGLGFKTEYMNLRVDPNYHGELRDSCRGIFKLPAKTRRIGGRWGNNKVVVGEKIHYSAKERFEHSTEFLYREGHAKKNLGPALKNINLSIAVSMAGEVNCHTNLTTRILNDGGGSPASIPQP